MCKCSVCSMVVCSVQHVASAVCIGSDCTCHCFVRATGAGAQSATRWFPNNLLFSSLSLHRGQKTVTFNRKSSRVACPTMVTVRWWWSLYLAYQCVVEQFLRGSQKKRISKSLKLGLCKAEQKNVHTMTSLVMLLRCWGWAWWWGWRWWWRWRRLGWQ